MFVQIINKKGLTMRFDPLLGANLRGKLGGIIASKNKAAAFFRVLIRPVQPNSVAQINAKNRFGSGAGIFRALSAINKALWNNFAQIIYSPRNTTNNGQYSGQQACQALSTSFNNAVAENRTFDVQTNGAPISGSETFVPFIGPLDIPPTNPTNSNLLLRPSGSISQQLTSAFLKSDGSFGFECQVGDGAGADIDSFKNASGVDIGWAVFASSGNPSANMHFQSKFRYMLGYLNHVEATVIADLDGTQNYDLASIDSFPIANYKTFMGLGETTLISVFAVDANNQMSLIGSKEIQVTAA